MQQKKIYKRGFTLSELLVVIAIIGILAAVIFVLLTGTKNNGRDAKVKAEVTQIKKVVEGYAATNGGYPYAQANGGSGQTQIGADEKYMWCIGSDGCKLADTTISNTTSVWSGDKENMFPYYPNNLEFKDTNQKTNKGYIYVSCTYEESQGGYCPIGTAYIIYPQTTAERSATVGTNLDQEYTSSSNLITSFIINGVSGSINQSNSTISLVLPANTSLVALTPIITTSPGSSVNPSSGYAYDFSSQRLFTVTAQNGTPRTYTVVVTAGTGSGSSGNNGNNGGGSQSQSSAKAITAFDFTSLNVTGSIDESNKAITLTVPSGTSLTSLIPTITTSPLSNVSPASGVAQDFTLPVQYTVTAQDGTQQSYTVSVTVVASSAKAITDFSISGTTGTVDEANHTIAITMPEGTFTTSLTPTITSSPNSTVSPTGPQDFTAPFTYTVTAQDNSTQQYTVKVSRYQWQTVGAAGFSTGATTVTNKGLALDYSDIPYVAYVDNSVSYKSTVMKWNGTSWVLVGTQGFSASNSDNTSIALDSYGAPYVAYRNSTAPQKVTVMKWDGTSWVLVGVQDFSTGGTTNLSFALDSSDTPYVAYRDSANGNKVTVMKFNGTSWVVVGPPGFTSASTNEVSLAIDSDDMPYVAYQGTLGKATVMKWDGTSWSVVGTPGFSALGVYKISLAFSPDGTPYVACADPSAGGYYGKAFVRKFDGASWVAVGTPGFSAGDADNINIVFDSNGTPYVSYRDMANSSKITVQKFNGTSWNVVGTPGFSTGGVNAASLALDSNGIPYVAYNNNTSGNKATVMKYALFTP